MKKALAIFFLIVWSTIAVHSRADDVRGTPAVLVELFTSEGCSSCPPADAWLERIDASQPIPGARIIALTEHVDYWDHDGWKDPYSLHSLTERQNAYSQALGLSSVYTPQAIVDGTRELHLNDSRQVIQAFQKAVAEPRVPINVSSVQVEGADTIRAQIEADGSAAPHNADVYVALALNHAESQIGGGENSGRRLTYVAVVESLQKVGTLKKGKSFSQDVQMKLKPGMDATNVRVVAFLQESGPGKVLGAAQGTPGK